MIVTEIYNGQGLGNQLWCYVTTRVLAADKGFAYGIQSPEKLKCLDFMNLDCGKPVIGGNGPEGGPPLTLPQGIEHYYMERRLSHPADGCDIRTYDNDLVAVPDNTKIDGIMQDEQYIAHRRNEIRQWLKVKEEFNCREFSRDDICVINFRGGEYVHIPDVFLRKQYWDQAVSNMRNINENFTFIVITDDVATAKIFFPHFAVYHFSVGKDYAIIKNAKYLILSNSSFAWFPAWLNEDLRLCIAPKYWCQHNKSDGYWSCGYNITSGWMYQDRAGNLQDYQSCKKVLDVFIKQHPLFYKPTSIENNFLVVSHYNGDIGWVPERSDNYLIYEKTGASIISYTVNKHNIVKTPNVGYNIYDYLTFIIVRYNALPDTVIFCKGNVFPRHVTKPYLDRIANSECFTPLEEARLLATHWPVSFISSDGGFCEINNSWYLNHHPTKYFQDYNDFLRFCFRNPALPKYIRFAPGANYIVPRANILKYPKVFYENLRTFVSHHQLAGEAHIVERALHTLWTCSFEVNGAMLRPIDESTFVALPKRKQQLFSKVKRKLANIAQSIMY